MAPEDVDRIAELLIEKIHERKHVFWVDPEAHYNDHKRLHNLEDDEMLDLKRLIAMFRTTQGLFFKAFIGLAIVGAITLAGYAAIRGLK